MSVPRAVNQGLHPQTEMHNFGDDSQDIKMNDGNSDNEDKHARVKQETQNSKSNKHASNSKQGSVDATGVKTLLNNEGKASKKSATRRAARACLACRDRKVRCDVLDQVPCGNCRWTNVECVVQSRRRKDGLRFPVSSNCKNEPPASIKKSHMQPFYPATVAPPHEPCAVVHHHTEPSLEWNIEKQLPRFLRPLPRRISSKDAEYLISKGALEVPGIALQNALLRTYADYVHPALPLINLHDFLAIVDRRDGFTGQISLVLYQAVMFAAVAFVDVKHLHEAGYPTRIAASRAFLQKAKVLYDFEYEPKGLVLVQALLLITWWGDEQDDCWHWMGHAISAAYAINLHRKKGAETIEPSQQKVWKRVWWCCYMHDRLLTLGMHRPARINEEDIDIPMLTISDFEIEQVPPANSIMDGKYTVMRDVSAQEDLAVICIFKVQLCLYVGCVLKFQYSAQKHNIHEIHLPYEKSKREENLNAIALRLKSWADSLPNACQYRTPSHEDVQSSSRTVSVQRSLLHMIYQTALATLFRPQSTYSTFRISTTAIPPGKNRERLQTRSASTEVTRMATDLQKAGLQSFLPLSGLMAITIATVNHLRDVKSPIFNSVRGEAVNCFKQGLHVLKDLRKIYPAADYTIGILTTALSDIEFNSRSRSLHRGARRAHNTKTSDISASQTSQLDTPPMTCNPEDLLAERSELEMAFSSNSLNSEITAEPKDAVINTMEFPDMDDLLRLDQNWDDKAFASLKSWPYDLQHEPSEKDLALVSWQHDQLISESDCESPIAGTLLDVEQWMQGTSHTMDNMHGDGALDLENEGVVL